MPVKKSKPLTNLFDLVIPHKKSILIVEDDEQISNLIHNILEINNYNTAVCNDGSEVFACLELKIPDLIIMDISMPIVDGIKTVRKMKLDSKYRYIPVILLTASNDERIIKDSFDLGIVDYISKPFKNLELVARINSAINLFSEKEKLQKINKNIIEKKNELEEQNRKLKQIDQIKDNFISYAAHDFKTPMTTIRSLAEILMDEKNISPLKRKEFLITIVKQVDNLHDMVKFLLSSFKTITENIVINKEEISLSLLIESVYENFKHLAEVKNLEFTRNINLTTDIYSCDFERLKEALSNIVSNAIKYTDTGYVKIEVYNLDNEVYFEVYDSGIGISEKEKDKIFEKFYRAKNALKSKEGTGLGLFIAKKIAVSHNGDVFFESDKSTGSKFTIMINS